MTRSSQSDLFRSQALARGVAAPRRGHRRRSVKTSAQDIDNLAHGLIEQVRPLAERDYPELWDALSEHGREQFSRSVIEAANRPPEDRVEAVRNALQAWVDAWQLKLRAPIDDEPFTDEERREVEEAEEQLARGEGIPLPR